MSHGDLGALWHSGHAAFNIAQFKAHFQGIQQWNCLGLLFTANISVEALLLLKCAYPPITALHRELLSTKEQWVGQYPAYPGLQYCEYCVSQSSQYGDPGPASM